MRIVNQSIVSLFLVAVIAMTTSLSSQAIAQVDKDPFESGEKQTAGPKKLSEGTLKDMRVRERLNIVADLVYDSEPFGDIRAKLAEDLGVNIVIDANLEGILEDDTEVTANLTGVILTDGLRTMLKNVDTTFTVKNGVLLLISIDDEQEPDFLTRQMLDVRELLKLIKEVESDRIGKPVAVTANANRGGKVGAGGGVFQLGPQATNGIDAANATPIKTEVQPQYYDLLTAEKILTDAIMRFVSSDAWQSNGGGNCDLKCIGGVLVISSSELVAGEVRDFVNDLEFQLRNPGK